MIASQPSLFYHLLQFHVNVKQLMSSNSTRAPSLKPSTSSSSSDTTAATTGSHFGCFGFNGIYASVEAQLIDEIMLRTGSTSVQSQPQQQNQPIQSLSHHHHHPPSSNAQSNAILATHPAAISALSVSTKSLNLNPFGPTSLHFPGVEHVGKSTTNRNTLTKSNSTTNIRHAEPFLLGATSYHHHPTIATNDSGGTSLPSFYNNYLPAHPLRNQPQPIVSSRNSFASSLKLVPPLSNTCILQVNNGNSSSSSTSSSLLNLASTVAANPLPPKRNASFQFGNRSCHSNNHRSPVPPQPFSSGAQMSSGDIVLAQQPIPPPPITNAANQSSATNASSRNLFFPHSIPMLPGSASVAATPSPHQPPLPPPASHRSIVMSSEFKRSNGEKPNTLVATPQRVMELYSNKLTPYEHHEIFKYPQIYFIGANAKKRPGISGPNNSDYDNEHGSYIHIQNDHVAYRYEVLQIIGKGSFGQVVKAYDHKTHEHVALKMVRNEKRFYRQAHEEIRILEHLRKQDKDNTMNIIHMYRSFEFRNHMCITFEILYINLYELIRRNKFHGFSLQLVRKFAHSLLQCLDALAKNNIIHCDMKPENVMLKQQGRSGIKENESQS